MANKIIIGPVQGPKGDRGPQGLKGDRGPQGETGKVPQSLLDDVLALNRDKFDKTGGTLTGDINIQTTTPTVTFTDSRGLPPVKIGYTKSGDNTFEIGSGVKTLQFGPDGVLRFNKDEVLTANSDVFKDKQDKTDNALQTDAKNVVEGINEVAKYTDGLATSKTVNSFPLSQATEGEVYRVPTTNKYVICTKNYSDSLISLPNVNFEELSVFRSFEKLRNIFKFKRTQLFYTANSKVIKGDETHVIGQCAHSGLMTLKYMYKQKTAGAGFDNLFIKINGVIVGETNAYDGGGEGTIFGTEIFYVNSGDTISFTSRNSTEKDFNGYDLIGTYYNGGI